MNVRFFTDTADEALYRYWMDENPDQFVVNTHKTPTSHYLILHRVGTHCLAKQNPLLRYSKLCGDRARIEEHVERNFGFNVGAIHECGNCFSK